MSKISLEEFEQYVGIEDKLWNMGREFFNEVQMYNPQALAAPASLCHYDDVYVDGIETLEIGYESFIGGDYNLHMIEVSVKEFLEDHIKTAQNLPPCDCPYEENLEEEDYICDDDIFEQLKKMNEDIDSNFDNFEY